MKSIYDLTYEKLQIMFLENSMKKYRSDQCFQWLYRKQIDSFDKMSDLGKETIEWLKNNFYIETLKLVDKQVAKDKTTKYLFELSDGALIETVLMHYSFGKSVCITSQVGCNMGFTFCASGLLKKQRNLSSGEMVAQVLYVNKELLKEDERVRNVVIMGTGEPFDNYDNVIDFCKIINHDKGLAIGARKITISTCGIVPKIYDFSDEKVQYNLAISLHAPNDELRNKLMPINKAYPLEELFKALRYYSEKNNRRLTFEYILLKGVNDQEKHAVQLSKLLKGMNAFVNLIPYNQVDEHGFKSTDDKSALRFYDWLMKNKVKATLRTKHGDDIDAACGQLRAKHERID
ncbi:MAG: 23S rRNA (adenine(2503)-C(2))-methyltransferase RlmN [Erysipelotrichaceae bacterium]|nr:23S rRNA (adenine(2503)-C(2))-methyltransferase RlmN [Erysipelotrichaceae bacterium]